MNWAISKTDRLDPARAAAMAAVLDRPDTACASGDPLPPFWHYIYFWDALPAAQLGSDGHPKTGGFIPDLGLPRRMWAGGALRFKAPILLDQPAQRRSRIHDIAEKTGRSGRLAIVTIEHDIVQDGQNCLSEKQTLVYREAAKQGTAPPPPQTAPIDEDAAFTRCFSSTDLFRYSALTLNGHKIHYDRDYARNTEGYQGLVVHGPLLAQTLIHLAQDHIGALSGFTFRAVAPSFEDEALTFCSRHTDACLTMWIRGPDGRLIMQAKAFSGALQT